MVSANALCPVDLCVVNTPAIILMAVCALCTMLSGHTYERDAIIDWISKVRCRSHCSLGKGSLPPPPPRLKQGTEDGPGPFCLGRGVGQGKRSGRQSAPAKPRRRRRFLGGGAPGPQHLSVRAGGLCRGTTSAHRAALASIPGPSWCRTTTCATPSTIGGSPLLSVPATPAGLLARPRALSARLRVQGAPERRPTPLSGITTKTAAAARPLPQAPPVPGSSLMPSTRPQAVPERQREARHQDGAAANWPAPCGGPRGRPPQEARQHRARRLKPPFEALLAGHRAPLRWGQCPLHSSRQLSSPCMPESVRTPSFRAAPGLAFSCGFYFPPRS